MMEFGRVQVSGKSIALVRSAWRADGDEEDDDDVWSGRTSAGLGIGYAKVHRDQETVF